MPKKKNVHNSNKNKESKDKNSKKQVKEIAPLQKKPVAIRPPSPQYVYFPLKTNKTGQTLSFTVKENPYKLLHTSLDALIRHLQRNQMSFKYYAIVPLSVIPVAKHRFNLEGEISAILPFKFKVVTVKPLNYEKYHPTISPMHRQNRLMPSYIYGL